MKAIEESFTDKNAWWNKVKTMKEDEIEQLPDEYVRKFGAYIVKASEMES